MGTTLGGLDKWVQERKLFVFPGIAAILGFVMGLGLEAKNGFLGDPSRQVAAEMCNQRGDSVPEIPDVPLVIDEVVVTAPDLSLAKLE